MHPTPTPPVPDSPDALIRLWSPAAWHAHACAKVRTCFEFARAALDGRLPALDSAPPSKVLRVAATYERAGRRWFARRWLPADAVATRLRLLGLA